MDGQLCSSALELGMDLSCTGLVWPCVRLQGSSAKTIRIPDERGGVAGRVEGWVLRVLKGEKLLPGDVSQCGENRKQKIDVLSIPLIFRRKFLKAVTIKKKKSENAYDSLS